MKQPREAWIMTRDGEKVPCLLEEVAPSKWQATPVRDINIEDFESSYVDVLPGHSEISFMLMGVEE